MNTTQDKPSMPAWEKLRRNGEVAILYSPGYGAGWYSWNTDHKGLLFDSEIVEAVLAEDLDRAHQIAEAKYPNVYLGGLRDIKVMWIPEGQMFEIEEYDGYERVHVIGGRDYLVA